MNWLTRLQLRDTLLIIGVLPAAVLALVLSLFFGNTLITDIENNLKQQGISQAKNLANASVFGVFTMNIDQLEALADIAVQDHEVLAVKLLDRQQQVIVQRTNRRFVSEKEKNRAQDFQVPIHSGDWDNISDDDLGDLLMNLSPNDPEYLGSVVLTLSAEKAKSHEVSVKLNSFYITLLSLLIIAVIAGRMSRAISDPILKLSTDVQRIANGDYRSTDPIQANNELGNLSKGIRSMSEQLESYHKDLELKIQLATQQLEHQNQELSVARQEAEQASQLKSQFLAHMSHEIRTPMNGIIGFLDMLSKTPINATQKLYLDTVQNSSRNLLRIINEVLDLSRLEAGRTEIIYSTFNLENALTECMDLLRPQASQRFVTLRLTLDADLPELIHQDPVRLNQVLINLVGNAIKFSYQSEVHIHVSRDASNERNALRFVIDDHGTGIDEANLPHLFDPFTQFNQGQTQQGSGLGLAISKQIIDSVGGEIGVSSTLYVGSSFWFTFPYESAQADRESSATHSLDQLNLNGRRFLIADDNDINLHLLTLMLEKHGAVVDQAVDGQIAVMKSRTVPYDMLMFDVIMPNQSGTDALREIREDLGNPNADTPAIAITALPTQQLQEELIAVSIQGCLTKPIFEADLVQVLDGYFAQNPERPPIQQNDAAPRDEEIESLPDFERWRAMQQLNQDVALIRQLLTKLKADLPAQRAEIRTHLNAANFEQAKAVVHKIHGSAAYCATPRLKHCAKLLEIALVQQHPQDRAAAWSALQQSIERLLAMSVDDLLQLK